MRSCDARARWPTSMRSSPSAQPPTAWGRGRLGTAGGYDPGIGGIEKDDDGNVTIKAPVATSSAHGPAPGVHITVSLDTVFAGFDQARARFQQAQTEREGAGVTYISLFEALSWTTALNDRLKVEWSQRHRGSREWWVGLAGSDVALGLNFARNCVLHDWASALQLDESGHAYPRSYPKTYHEWRWRSGLTSRRSDKPDKPGEAAYNATLCGVPARHTLDAASALFVAAAATCL